MNIGIQSYCYRNFDFAQTIHFVRDLGLDRIEFCPLHLSHEMSAEEIATRQQQLEAVGLKQTAYGVVRLTKDATANRPIFDYVKRFNTPVITADPDPDSFDALDAMVAEFDVKVAIHNHGPKHRWQTAQQMLAAVANHDPRIGVCLDTSWAIHSGDDPIAAIHRLGERLHAIHIKDSTETEDVIIGTGRLDLPATLHALRDVHFTGPLSIEYENHPDNPQPHLMLCVTAIRSVLARAGSSS